MRMTQNLKNTLNQESKVMKFKFETKFFQKPSRVVLLGTSGIISKNLQLKLKKNKVKFIKFGRKNLNLKSKFSIKILKKK